MRRWCGVAFLAGVVAVPGWAAPPVEEALAALSAAAEQEANLSPRFREALSDVVDALRAEREEQASATVSSGPAAEGELDGLFGRIRPFGDMRLRYEHNRNQTGRDDRNRARLRLRLGAEIDLLPELVAGFRVRTGNPDDPNSPHQTFGNMFDSYDFELDRAYLRYSPGWVEGVSLVGGKFAHPFVSNPVYGELVWDADVNPRPYHLE